jgi:MFS transporter, MHS family, proline/betaine transporter
LTDVSFYGYASEKKLGDFSMGFFSSLTRRQKESTALLQGGTFLEYFDLMLYVHMAVFLNELFFPQTTGFTASLLGAFAFCSTFVFRPFGALIFGYIGDRIGRKQTVVITSLLMSFSCVTMAFVPTYETIGISAAWIVTICRALQGMSSMGEVIGAEIYLTETIPLPARYPAVAWLTVFATIGSMAALGIATLVVTFSYDWRPIFFFGATIAVIGSVARTTLRETPDFIKNRHSPKQNRYTHQTRLPQKSEYKTLLAMFFIFCSGPVWLYFAFIYCGNILRNTFGYTASELIQNNFIVAIFVVVVNIIFAQLTYRIYPLKIIKFFLAGLLVCVVLLPYLLNHVVDPFHILLVQSFVAAFGVGEFPASSVFFRHFPVLKRMTLVSMGYALAKAFMYIITSFGLIYLDLWMGHWGLWVLMIPSLMTYTWALKYFEKLDLPYQNALISNMAKKQPIILSKAA